MFTKQKKQTLDLSSIEIKAGDTLPKLLVAKAEKFGHSKIALRIMCVSSVLE
jgi:hypothetical protein